MLPVYLMCSACAAAGAAAVVSAITTVSAAGVPAAAEVPNSSSRSISGSTWTVAVERSILSDALCVLALHAPMYVHLYRFLSTKPARGALRRAGQVFPGAQQVTLFHANGWCDPVQARMDVEPLVRLESRLVSLEPLALGLPQLTRLAIHDATFTRDPWPLSQLLWLTGLKGLEVAWDTGLWAPGQVLQEAEALQVRSTAAGTKRWQNQS